MWLILIYLTVGVFLAAMWANEHRTQEGVYYEWWEIAILWALWPYFLLKKDHR